MSDKIEIINPFTDIPLADLPAVTNENQGATFLSNLRELNVGDGGSNVFRADKSGIWLGAETFVTAKFSVSMAGAIVGSDFTLIGGTLKYGKTSFTDSVNAGYFLSALGAYFGSAADATKWKFTLADGSIDYIGAHSGGSVAGIPVAQVGYVATETADAVPSGLTCSSTGISTGSDGSQSAYVVLTWTAVSSNTFDYYLIRYKKASYTYYTYVPAKTNTITIEGLTPNVSYNFGLASVNKYGIQSAFSADISQTTASDTVAPATVATVSSAGGIQYNIVEWAANAESDLSYYNIYRSETNDSATAVKIGSTKTTYFVDGNRVGGTTYYYWIKATDTSGNESAAFSTVSSATPRNVTSDDIVTIAGSKVLIDGVVYLSNWRHSSDLTKIDGGNIYANSVTLTQLNFTPVQTGNVIASINASAEGITIDADNITVSGSTTFASGYDPTGKVAALAGSYASAASGARVLVFPSATIGLQVIDDGGTDVLKVMVGGTDVGDVIIGNWAGGQGIKYDKSANTTTFAGNLQIASGTLGAITAGSLTGLTITGGIIQTAASGARTVITGNDEYFYDATTGGGGVVTGDAATIFFPRTDNNWSGNAFYQRKRVAISDDYSNVLEIFPSAAANSTGKNYLFLGRQGSTLTTYTDYLTLACTTEIEFQIGTTEIANITSSGFTLVNGALLPYSDSAYNIGASGTAWQTIFVDGIYTTNLYAQVSSISLQSNIIPNTDSARDLGSTSVYFNEIFTDHLRFANDTPANPGANAFQLGCQDFSPGNTYLTMYGEGNIIGTGTPTQTRTIPIQYNGTTYYLLAATVAS